MMWVGVVDDIGPFLFYQKRENYIRKGFICAVKTMRPPKRHRVRHTTKKKQPVPLMGTDRLVFMRGYSLFLILLILSLKAESSPQERCRHAAESRCTCGHARYGC